MLDNIENYGVYFKKLDKAIHDITYDQLKLLYEDNIEEEKESRQIIKEKN